MNNETLLTTPITKDAKEVIDAINQRTRDIHQILANISMSKKIAQTFAKILIIVSGIVAAVTVPVAVYHLSLKPLAFGAASLAVAIAGAAALVFADSRSPTEEIIKKQWQQLFAAMKGDDGSAVIRACEALLKKKREEKVAFSNALMHVPADVADRFLQKSLFTGNLLIALRELDNENTEKAKSHAHLALASFVLSGLPKEAADCAHAIVNKPGRVINRLNQSGCPKTITDLDAFITMMYGSLDDEYLHDFVRL